MFLLSLPLTFVYSSTRYCAHSNEEEGLVGLCAAKCGIFGICTHTKAKCISPATDQTECGCVRDDFSFCFTLRYHGWSTAAAACAQNCTGINQRVFVLFFCYLARVFGAQNSRHHRHHRHLHHRGCLVAQCQRMFFFVLLSVAVWFSWRAPRHSRAHNKPRSNRIQRWKKAIITFYGINKYKDFFLIFNTHLYVIHIK